MLAKNNKACGKNNDIKRDIDLLRRERVVFESVFQRMKQELADNKVEEHKQTQADIDDGYMLRDQAQKAMHQIVEDFAAERAGMKRSMTTSMMIIESEKRALNGSRPHHSIGIPLVVAGPRSGGSASPSSRSRAAARRQSSLMMQDQQEDSEFANQLNKLKSDLQRIEDASGANEAAVAAHKAAAEKQKRGGNQLSLDVSTTARTQRIVNRAQNGGATILRGSRFSTRFGTKWREAADEVKAMDAHFNELLEKKKEVNANRASELSKHRQILLSLKSELSDARGA